MTTFKKVLGSLLTTGRTLTLVALFTGCDVPADSEALDGSAIAVATTDGGAPEGRALAPTVEPGLDNAERCTTESQCTTGFCVDGVCCDAPCDGACVSCAQTGKVGTCAPVVDAQDDACDGEAICDAAGKCHNALGRSCAGAGDCASGSCVDGVCCDSAACGTCQTCAAPGSEGVCALVAKFADDPDTCPAETNTCNGLGACQVRNGATCSASAECVSGQCVDGVCCDQGCSGTCFSCNQPGRAGRCSPIDAAEDHAASVTCEGASSCTAPSGAAPACKLKDGQPCTANDDCLGGSCLSSYLDRDTDGYGTAGSKVRRCERTPQAGYVLAAGDCCDTDADANPGVTAYSAKADACGSFDWDCSGAIERLGSPTAGCGYPPNPKFPAAAVACK
jgi:hypothetical protein